jgi:anti-anti-sigma factor
MVKDAYPVQWTGKQAVVRLPEHIDASNTGQIREQLLRLVNRGAVILIADMTGTVSCDHGGADALVRAYDGTAVNGTQLRVAVSAQIVRRVLDASGLDRLISIYPSVEAAIAGVPADVLPLTQRPAPAWADGQDTPRRGAQVPGRARAAGSRQRPRVTAVTPGVLWGLIDALADGVVLTHDDGVMVLANRRAEEMFGYAHGELAGRPVESLIPADLRAAHVGQRAVYAREPSVRLMGARARLVGLRKDGSTFPVQVSLSPVPTATGRFTLAVIRDVSEIRPHADLADLARAVAAEQAHRGRDLLDRVVKGLFHVGLSLQSATDLPHEVAMQRIADALLRLDDTIREIRDHTFATRDQNGSPDPPPRNRSR